MNEKGLNSFAMPNDRDSSDLVLDVGDVNDCLHRNEQPLQTSSPISNSLPLYENLTKTPSPRLAVDHRRDDDSDTSYLTAGSSPYLSKCMSSHSDVDDTEVKKEEPLKKTSPRSNPFSIAHILQLDESKNT